MNEENQQDGKLLPVADPLLEKMKNTFFDEYFPVHTYRPGVIFKSSAEIYLQLQKHYPSDDYSVGDIAQWLHEKGYNFRNSGDLKYEWLLWPSDEHLQLK